MMMNKKTWYQKIWALLMVLLIFITPFLGLSKNTDKLLLTQNTGQTSPVSIASNSPISATNNRLTRTVNSKYSFANGKITMGEHFQSLDNGKYLLTNEFTTFLTNLNNGWTVERTETSFQLAQIVNFFQEIWKDGIEVTDNQGELQMELKIDVPQNIPQLSLANLLSVLLPEFYTDFQSQEMQDYLDNHRFNPTTEKDYLTDAISRLINDEQLNLEISPIPGCFLLSQSLIFTSVELRCPEINFSFTEKEISYGNFVKSLYDISKWMYNNLGTSEKNKLNWIESDGLINLTAEKILILFQKYENITWLKDDLWDNIIETLFEKIDIFGILSDSTPGNSHYERNRDTLINHFVNYAKYEMGLAGRVLEGTITEMLRSQIKGKSRFNEIKTFAEAIILINKTFEKYAEGNFSRSENGLFREIISFLSSFNQASSTESSLMTKESRLANLLYNLNLLNLDFKKLWIITETEKREIQNLINDQADAFFAAQKEREYIWKSEENLRFEGQLLPYLKHSEAETNNILTVRWISADPQRNKYTVAIQRGENNNFEIIYFAPNHWEAPLNVFLANYYLK